MYRYVARVDTLRARHNRYFCQASALRANANNGNNNFYATNWIEGPAPNEFTIGGALAGLDVLTAGIGPWSKQRYEHSIHVHNLSNRFMR
jgi:hypothetical protein